MPDKKPDRQDRVPRADEDWDAWRKHWEDAGVFVRPAATGAVVDLESLQFLPFTEDEISRMFVRLRRTGKL